MERHEWDERYSGPDLVWGPVPNRFVVEELAGLRPGRALDLGTGEGRNAIWLAAQGWQVTGVDFSAAGLARAAALAAERGVTVDWVNADLRAYRPEPGAYDLVLIAYLQMRADPLAGVLAGAAAALAPGGTLLVVGHDRENLSRGVGGPQDPELLYTPDQIVAGLSGLTVRAPRHRHGGPRSARVGEGRPGACGGRGGGGRGGGGRGSGGQGSGGKASAGAGRRRAGSRRRAWRGCRCADRGAQPAQAGARPAGRRDLDGRGGPGLPGDRHPARGGLARAGPGGLQDRRQQHAAVPGRRLADDR